MKNLFWNLRKLRKTGQNKQRQQKYCDNCKIKLDFLNKATKRMITGKKTAGNGTPKNIDNSTLTKLICQIAITGSPANGRQWSEVIPIQSRILI